MIFPELKDKKIGYVNLNTEAGLYLKKNPIPDGEINPLLDPEKCWKMIESINQKYNIDYSYGGWMENRNILAKDSYLEEDNKFVHLGIDVNVPRDTKVAISYEAVVVKIDSDYPDEGGWGTRVIFKHLNKPHYIIYAHLDDDVLVKEGERVVSGKVFAKIGSPPKNGNWFDHLHVQVVDANYFEDLLRRNVLPELDGYGYEDDILKNSKIFPDPLNFLSLF